MPADLIELHEYEEAIGISNIVTNSIKGGRWTTLQDLEKYLCNTFKGYPLVQCV